MGVILTVLKPVSLERPSCPLLNTSLSKLREYHASFKSICNDFGIDLTEFEQIFSTNESSFTIWDTDDNGVIDALELFSGLVLFSEARFSDKLRFLFDLFDFNELGQLSNIELQFMLLMCLNSTFKIYGVAQEADNKVIEDFVDSFFEESKAITAQRLIKWCINSQEINEFFSLIKKDAPGMKTTNASINFAAYSKFETKTAKARLEPSRNIQESKSINKIYNSQKYKTKLEYLMNLMSKSQPSKDENPIEGLKIKDSIAKMNWVYGFRCNDIRHPLLYVGTEIGKATSEKLFYVSGCVVVIYFSKSNEQNFYLEHEKEVVSLTVSKSGLVASGELGESPAIHVWDSTTLQNMAIMRGIHQNGVHLLTFLKNNEFVASCGLRNDSPLLIYSVRDSSLVLSTYIHGFALDLRIVVPYVRTQYDPEFKCDETRNSPFVVCTEKSLYLFTYESNVFENTELTLKDIDVDSPITCCLSYTLNMKSDDKSITDQKLIVLTGHKDGRVMLLEDLRDKKELENFGSAVVDMICLDSGVVIAFNPSTLHFWDFMLKNRERVVDLSARKFKSFSLQVGSLTSAGKKLYAVSLEGDVLEVISKPKKDAANAQTTQISRLTNICKIRGDIKAIATIERPDDTLVYLGGRAEAVSGFSTEGHNLVYLTSIEEAIVAMDAISIEDNKKKLAIGTTSGVIEIRIEAESTAMGYKHSPPTERHQCGGEDPTSMFSVLDLKFSGDGKYLFVVCIEAESDLNIMYLFELKQGYYFRGDEAIQKFYLENEVPISVNFSDDDKIVLIGTSQRTHHLLDLTQADPKLVKMETLGDRTDFSLLNIRYPSHTKNFRNTMQPIGFWNTMKALLSADDSGVIFHWKDLADVSHNCAGVLRGHSSPVARFALTKNSNIFFSVGMSDRTLIEWQIQNITEEPQKGGNAELAVTEEKDNYKIHDEPLNREIGYCKYSDIISTRTRDSFVYFRGTTNNTINAMLYDTIAPFDDTAFNKRIPPLSLDLHFVYGFQSSERRNTLFYAHSHRAKPRKPTKQDEKELKGREDPWKINKEAEENNDGRMGFVDKEGGLLHLPPYIQKQMFFSTRTPILYDVKHEYCERYFVYFVSRIAIIYNFLTNEQRFYEGHRHRISTLAMHPSKMIVATGETSLTPCIHVWSVVNLEPFKVIQTFHKDGILHLKFSNDGAFLISISADSYFSIQIINWKTEETLAYRNTGSCPIFDVIFNPYNKYEFTTVGHHNIAVWELQGRSLTRKNWIHLKPTDALEPVKSEKKVFPAITVAAYLNYHLGKEVDSDIIVGTSEGEIGLITFGKYVCLKKNAHSAMINCLKVTDMLVKKLLIITTGEDEYIRIWDTTFNLIYEDSIRRLGLLDVPSNKNISIQSIDVYCCQSPSQNDYYRQKDLKEDVPSKPIILLGTRNGDILEAAVNQTFSGLKSTKEASNIHMTNLGITIATEEEANDEDDEDDIQESDNSSDEDESGMPTLKSAMEGTLSLSFKVYLRNHCGKVTNSTQKHQQRVLFALHPFSQRMFTVGEDQHIYLWDIDKSKLLLISNQNLTPSALKLSTNAEILAVGFNNGTIALLDAKVDTTAGGNEYALPTLEWVQPAIMERFLAPVINIEFSYKGNWLAVSYAGSNAEVQSINEPSTEGGIANDTRLKSSPYVAIFFNNSAGKALKTRGAEKSQYTPFIEIRHPNPGQTLEADPNIHGVAVYYMTFSVDENFILLYYQSIDKDLVRINDDPHGQYVIWSLNHDNQVTQVTNLEVIKTIRWRRKNFPNSLYAQYSFYDDLLGSEDIKKDFASGIKRPIISSMFNYKPFIVGGSTNGDIHFFKDSGLYLEKNYSPENLTMDKMCMSKTHTAHVSFINQIEVKGNYLFSTGERDGCVIQWRLTAEEDYWDADFLDLSAEEQEINNLSDLPSRDKFVNLLNEVLQLRKQVGEIKQNTDAIENPEIELELEAIIGRKAYDRRNNLFYDFDEKIIYSAGNMIVMHDVNAEKQQEADVGSKLSIDEDDKEKKKATVRNQELLRVDEESLFPTAPEISALALSLDKRFICVGTQEIDARLLIWEVCSRTCIKILKLNNCTSIQNIKFAFNARHVCAVGVTPDYTQIVYLIDTLRPQVLGCVNLINTFTNKIRDIMFFPNSIYKFVTCGVQHMSVWKYSGSVLNFSAYSIEKPKDMMFIKPSFTLQDEGLTEQQKEELEKLKAENQHPILRVTFTCLCFVQNTPVTGDTNGFIYIWQNSKISKRQTAHFKSSVLCLNALKNSSIFVSGGEDGRVIVWQLSRNNDNSFVTAKFCEYSVTGDDITRASRNPRNHVQSIFVGSHHILAGTKAGDIYELLRPSDSDLKSKNFSYDNLVVTRLSCNDHEIPKSLGFSHKMDKIYAITQKGLFCVWDIRSLNLLNYYSFNRSTTSMIAFKNRPLILVTFEHEIIMLNAERGGNYKPMDNYRLKYQTQITDVKVSYNEKYMAVALSSDSDTNARIELYDLENHIKKFMYLFDIADLGSSVNFLDFSTDNSYLLHKDNFGVLTVTNIISRSSKVNINHLEFDIEWISDGIKESETTKGVQSYYKPNNGVSNKILKMIRIGKRTLAVTDEMGTLRLFRYPCETGSNVGYYRCYTEHMNYLNNCVLSNDRNYLLTSSENDKSVFLWKIIKSADGEESIGDLPDFRNSAQ